MKKVLLAATLVFAAAACATRPIAPITGNVPVERSLKQVEAAIARAAVARTWQVKNTGAGSVELTLVNRKHTVIVDVKYTKETYTIAYKNSVNMKYNAANNTIHPKYTNWVNNLRLAIDQELVKTP